MAIPRTEPSRAVTRSARLRAAGIDFGSALLVAAAGVVLATAWLLLRTATGRDDVVASDAVFVVSFVAATVPAWAAWLAVGVWRNAATPGQRRGDLAVATDDDSGRDAHRGTSQQRLLRLAAHPLSLPLWGWLTLTMLLSGLPWLWLAPLFVALAVAGGGLTTLALLLLRPQSMATHDRVARTHLASVAGER